MIFLLPHNIKTAPNAVITKVCEWLPRHGCATHLLFLRDGRGRATLFQSKWQMMLLFVFAPFLLLRAAHRMHERAIHSSGLLPDFILAIVRLFSGSIRATCTVHANLASEYSANFPRLGRILAKIHICSLHRMDKVICTSSYVYDSLPASLNKVVVHNSIDTRFFERARVTEKSELLCKYQLQGRAKSLLFLVVAKLVAVKGVDRAIKAFRAAATDGILVIVGAGPDLEHLRTSAAGDNNIFFVGPMDDVLPFYDIADCLIVPSRSEGFCLVFVEGAIRGVPVVASNLPVFHELRKLLRCTSIRICNSSDDAGLVHFLTKEIEAVASSVRRHVAGTHFAMHRAVQHSASYFSDNEMCRRYHDQLYRS